MAKQPTVIVVGLGAMGSAAAYHLATRGARVIGIDRFMPPHAFGSSHGDTRIIRRAIGEGEQYAPLIERSYALWRELERKTGSTLLQRTGGLLISNPGVTTINHAPQIFERTIALAKVQGIPHEVWDAKGIRRHFPQFDVASQDVGYYEPDAGFLKPEACIAAHLVSAASVGDFMLHAGQKVLTVNRRPSGRVRVRTDLATYEADRVVIAAGPWVGDFLGRRQAALFKVRRQVLFWFEILRWHADLLPGSFPVFVWEVLGKAGAFYGFPAIDGPLGGIKVAGEQQDVLTLPDQLERKVSKAEIEQMYETYVAGRLPGIGPRCIRSAACMYTMAPDGHFLIDRHPRMPEVIVASPCSGHGFKHSAAIGEAVAEMALHGSSTIDLSAFSWQRFASV